MRKDNRTINQSMFKEIEVKPAKSCIGQINKDIKFFDKNKKSYRSQAAEKRE